MSLLLNPSEICWALGVGLLRRLLQWSFVFLLWPQQLTSVLRWKRTQKSPRSSVLVQGGGRSALLCGVLVAMGSDKQHPSQGCEMFMTLRDRSAGTGCRHWTIPGGRGDWGRALKLTWASRCVTLSKSVSSLGLSFLPHRQIELYRMCLLHHIGLWDQIHFSEHSFLLPGSTQLQAWEEVRSSSSIIKSNGEKGENRS